MHIMNFIGKETVNGIYDYERNDSSKEETTYS